MRFRPLLFALAASFCAACTQQHTPPTAVTPAPHAVPPAPVLPISNGKDQNFKVEIEPKVNLAVWVLQPPAGTPIRGTILLLHGFATDHALNSVGQAFRKAGYRSVLVDLRGWGQSTGAHTDFGVTDARDMIQLVNTLQKQDLCGSTVGVYGTSLGAATALIMAADDPRVVAVVAVASFTDIRQEVPNFARGALGSVGNIFGDSVLNTTANLVGKVVNWNFDNAHPLEAIAKTKAQVLLIHGDADTYVPLAASQQLHDAAPNHSSLITAHNHGHVDLCFELPADLQNATCDWFNRNLMPGGTP